jgi:hypothetical protein
MVSACQLSKVFGTYKDHKYRLPKSCERCYQGRRCFSLLVNAIEDQRESFLTGKQSFEMDL